MMRYPEQLVHRYGAKAGILLYVAKELPDIPQVAMVVNEPGESDADFLKRADAVPILYPRLFRSSAVAELAGYEGEFPTREVDGYSEEGFQIDRIRYFTPFRDRRHFEKHVAKVLAEIRTCPQEFKKQGLGTELPDEINVIIAEKAPSEYIGTLVAHPHQNDEYLIAVTSSQSMHTPDPQRSVFSYHPKRGIAEVRYFSQGNIRLTDVVKQDLGTVVSWHDRIARLPEMDAGWSYQIEFGIDPPCLFQVRPFLEKQNAGFRLSGQQNEYINPIVFGITPPDGIDARIETNVWGRKCKGEQINPDNQPSVFADKLRVSHSWDDVPNLKATVLTNCTGILAHGDIRAIRQARVAILYSTMPHRWVVRQEGWVNIISDGINVEVNEIKPPKH